MPRQLPLDLDLVGRVRAGRRAAARRLTAFDGYFLEYDSERAGGFEPLRFLPKGDKVVELGLVTTKSGDLESKTGSSAASTRPPRSRRSISSPSSPQCGFASTEEGNVLTEAEQWAKMRGDRRGRRRRLGQLTYPAGNVVRVGVGDVGHRDAPVGVGGHARPVTARPRAPRSGAPASP